MAHIIPFKAVRPTRDKVSLVASRSYQSYTKEQVESRLRDNPFSFLHIINPGYRFAKDVVGKARYALVKNRYLEFKEDGIFIEDEKPTYYVYRIVNRDGDVFNGIIAAASAIDYEKDAIKKHEDTLAYKEIIFKEYLKAVGFNAEPVLLTYPDNASIAQIIAKVQKNRPEYEFTTTYRDTHYMWLVEDDQSIQKIQAEFEKMPVIYIADGHHRSASSFLLYEDLRSENPNHNPQEPYNYFMSYLIPESDLKIYEFNRLVKDLNGLSKEEFLIKLDAWYRIENRGKKAYKPSKQHHFSMYMDGEFYSLYLRKSLYKFETALDTLDAQLLYKTILNPILGISDLRHNDRIEYTNGKNDIVDVKSCVDSGDYKVGFGMVPATVEQMKQIADEGLTMPPKSTYVLPKLRSGVTIYEF
ncbi:DUF1015 domain-containing protein [Mangrovimonas sp. AS39]|uniref:DUF1015 domain-containing protein n=1 Tax=Mangrovimonas futianensis TaxID=2895523 RepID=UPI001E2B3FA7|nr:DUF1015 domain-containing protein [Mangrovimonas futianensis]MCF1192652.1 DUF1015 domain-containing protein [Mangrovimonas futianensis]MCF1196427.1 DUF1015 domain-containing protein [Mangrovimonas futianensis]